jgi:hypothetical protein
MASVQLVSANDPMAMSGRSFEEHEVKHLELVQSIISRMAQNSFQVRSWSVTLVTILFALAAKDSSLGLAILALFPAISFWCLDAYYLRQERLYRRLYEAIADPQMVVPPFSMSTEKYGADVSPWAKTLAAEAILPLHAANVMIILAEILTFMFSVWITVLKR